LFAPSLAEFGLIIPIGIQHLQQKLPELIADATNGLTFTIRRLLYVFLEDMQALNERGIYLDR